MKPIQGQKRIKRHSTACLCSRCQRWRAASSPDLPSTPPGEGNGWTGVTKDEARDALTALVSEGWLIGVMVFGTDQCCQHGDHVECKSTGFGLCDGFSEHAVGSDCNRAERWLMRPHDDLHASSSRNASARARSMTTPTVLRACEATTYDGGPGLAGLRPVQCGAPGRWWTSPSGRWWVLCAEHEAVFERAMELDS